MVASLKFESAAGTAAATLAEVKLVTLADNTDNKYTLDITTDDLKVAYTPNGGQAKEYIVDGLAAALGKLLTIDGSTAGKSVLAEEVAKKPVVDALIPELAKDDGINGIYTKKGVDDELAKKADTSAIPAAPDLSNYLETSKLAEEVVKQPVVDVLVPALATVGTDDTKKVYTKGTVDTSFVKTADLATKVAEEVVKQPVVDVLVPALATVGTDDTKKVYTKGTVDTSFVKIDASNLTDAANQKAFAEVILPAKDGKQSILVNKLGEALDRVQDNADDKVYGAQGSEKIAKDFLEPVHNLFRSKAAKARTTICRLVLSFRSQFFHNRLHFCNQAKDLSTTHLFGNTTKVCNSFRFITSTVAPIVAFICVAKFSPV